MSIIKVQLFNTPTVRKNNVKLLFPFRKAEALFYYMLINRQASRDELVNLLWGEMEENTAKKNLRNAIYKVKQVVGSDILLSPRKSVVSLNTDITIETDLDKFTQKNKVALQAYSGPFLKGFFVKDGESFENWMLQKRAQYQDRYVKMLYAEIEARKNDSQPVDVLAHCLIDTDEFDEQAYRILMRHYADSASYNKAIELYQQLCRTLQDELGVQPEGSTTVLYAEIINERNRVNKSAKAEREAFFFGRSMELACMKSAYRSYQESDKTAVVMILGEAGIGKTWSKDFFFKTLPGDYTLLQSNCYQAEEEYPLKPWYPMFSRMVDHIKEEEIDLPQVWVAGLTALIPSFARLYINQPDDQPENLPSFTYQSANEAILGILSAICEKKKLILVFEDMQWMDEMSRQLLRSVILSPSISIFFVGTCRNGYEAKIDGWLTPLVKEDRLEKIQLERFSMEEARDFARLFLPDRELSEQQFREIYRDTEGNTFFLVEYLNNIKSNDSFDKMSSKMLDILQSRFLDVSEEGMKLLHLLSLFFHRVPVEILSDLTGKDELEILDTLSELEAKGLIREVVEPKKISVEFTHQKLREYIYKRQSAFKKRLLHAKAAQVLERRLKKDHQDMLLYSKLIHHFANAGNHAAALKYHLKNLTIYLDYYHELFPEIIVVPDQAKRTFSISDEQLHKYFLEVESILHQIDGKNDDTALATDRMTYLHMKGRHLIRQGEYTSGVQHIKDLIQLANVQKNSDFLLKGYIQLIHHCIQTHRVGEMKEYLHHAQQVNQEYPRFETGGILLRVTGLYHMMMGEHREAEDLFWQSIHYFSEDKKNREKYALSIAACYNYLGEIHRYAQAFTEALVLYQQALDICEETGVYKSYSFFSTCAGQAAMDMGDDDKALFFLDQAVNYYEQSDLAWRRSIAEAYLALLLIRQGQYVQASKHLETAEIYVDKMKNPYESGLVWVVKSKIKAMMGENLQLADHFRKLHQPVLYYCDKSLRMVEQVPYCYEAEAVKNLCSNIS
jgi:DNA-binding SARP family transcriptional activator